MAGKRTVRRENLVVGLDIGTTKICAIVGEVTPEGIDIVGIGTAPSKGLRKGCVINIESTVGSIKEGKKIGFELARDQRSGKMSAG